MCPSSPRPPGSTPLGAKKTLAVSVREDAANATATTSYVLEAKRNDFALLIGRSFTAAETIKSWNLCGAPVEGRGEGGSCKHWNEEPGPGARATECNGIGPNGPLWQVFMRQLEVTMWKQ